VGYTFGTARRGLGGAAVPNATAIPSTASVPITVLHNGPLLCGFNVLNKGLIFSTEICVLLTINAALY